MGIIHNHTHMRKYLAVFSLAVLFLGAAANVAHADSYYWHLNWNDGSDTPQVSNLFLDGNYQYFVASNQSTRAPELWTFDTSFHWNEDTKQIGVGNISQDNVDLLVPALASKVATSTYNTQVDSFNTSIASLNTRFNAFGSSTDVQRISVQTDTSGNYTWTYPKTYPVGTLPVVNVISEDSTSGALTNVQITSKSRTAVSIHSSRLTTVLGILTLASNPQVYVDIMAVPQ